MIFTCHRYRLVLPILIASAVVGCSDQCANTMLAQSKAPGDRHRAVVFQRDCGATTGFSTQVSVLHADGEILGSGNAFVADDNHGAAEAASWGGPWAEAQWLAPRHLLVRYDASARVFEQDRDVSGVKITFKAVTR